MVIIVMGGTLMERKVAYKKHPPPYKDYEFLVSQLNYPRIVADRYDGAGWIEAIQLWSNYVAR